MSVILLPKFRINPDEDPEVTSERLHRRKNRPVSQDEGLDYPRYRFYPYPQAMYREWDPKTYQRELYKLAGKSALDLNKPNERQAVEDMLGEYETRNVGQFDCHVEGDNDPEVISEIREKNIREHNALRAQGWADRPDQVKAVKLEFERRTLATPAAELNYENRHLGEKAAAEFEAIDDASEKHVVDVPETRKQLKAEGKLK